MLNWEIMMSTRLQTNCLDVLFQRTLQTRKVKTMRKERNTNTPNTNQKTKSVDPAEWAKIMKNEYMMLRGLGIDDAKLRFLTQAQDLPLFGSTVFANLSSPSVTLVPASYDLAINMKVDFRKK